MKPTKHLRRTLVWVTTSQLSLLGVSAVSAAITIQTVPVGDLGNPSGPEGYGSVNYAYNIGEYDVTSSQYTAFLNAVAQSDPMALYNSAMAGTSAGDPGIIQSGTSGSYSYSVVAGRGNYPVSEVSFWDATRFANWLDNGQPTGSEGAGTTETGSYTLTPSAIANNTVTRNAGATWAVPTEDEWFKAAYYDPNITDSSLPYWEFPTQGVPLSVAVANYEPMGGGGVGDTTPVGSYPYPSYFGTYDQGGNVFQWNENIFTSTVRGIRGGSWAAVPTADGGEPYLASDGVDSNQDPSSIRPIIGFRVVEVPEPASFGFLALGLSGMLMKRRSVRG
jgi:sulfatase modifying factor 1